MSNMELVTLYRLEVWSKQLCDRYTIHSDDAKSRLPRLILKCTPTWIYMYGHIDAIYCISVRQQTRLLLDQITICHLLYAKPITNVGLFFIGACRILWWSSQRRQCFVCVFVFVFLIEMFRSSAFWRYTELLPYHGYFPDPQWFPIDTEVVVGFCVSGASASLEVTSRAWLTWSLTWLAKVVGVSSTGSSVQMTFFLNTAKHWNSLAGGGQLYKIKRCNMI